MSSSLEVSLAGPAFADDFVVLRVEVREELSHPPTATVLGVSPELDVDAAVGEAVLIEIGVDGEVQRRFHLVVTGLSVVEIVDETRRRYRVELGHELLGGRHRSDVRMFQEKAADTIVKEVLDGMGVPSDHVEWSLERPPAPRTYCIQYRETDLDFCARLLEEEGIFYFVRDGTDKTRVVIADNSQAFEPIDGDPHVHLASHGARGGAITDFEIETLAIPERVGLGDYNPDHPDLDLTSYSQASDEPYGEVFEYAAGHQTPAEGSTLAKIRQEEIVAQKVVGYGRSSRPTFVAGGTFHLEGVHDGLKGEYVLRSVSHEIRMREAGGASYENTFTCIPADVRFRPPRSTSRATVRGVHSAVVTGPSGSEIHTDARGSMKAKFFWDRLGSSDDKSSCWIRVAQLPIGGSVALARVGWEMAVAYVDGDPDRPHAFARFYNAEKVSPYGYPAAKTRMSFQTASSPGGGATNEIRMEDGSGGMELFVHSSKDFDGEVKNNRTETIAGTEAIEVGSDSGLIVGADQSVTIGSDLTATITGDDAVSVSGSRTETISGSETLTVSGNLTAVVEGSDSETTGGTHMTLAGLGVSRTSVGSHSLTVAGSMVSAAGLGCSMATAGAKSETIGGVKLTASGGTVTESVIGAYACTVGGACVHAAGGERTGSTSAAGALTVGGLLSATAAGKVAIEASSIQITVGGAVNMLGGGGVLNMTPGSVTLTGIVFLDASGAIKISGNPNLVG